MHCFKKKNHARDASNYDIEFLAPVNNLSNEQINTKRLEYILIMIDEVFHRLYGTWLC